MLEHPFQADASLDSFTSGFPSAVPHLARLGLSGNGPINITGKDQSLDNPIYLWDEMELTIQSRGPVPANMKNNFSEMLSLLSVYNSR